MSRKDDPPVATFGEGAPANAIGVFTTDTALIVRTWNAWLAEASGIVPDQAHGRPLAELIPDLAERGLLGAFESVLSNGTVEILAPAFHHYLIACPPSAPSQTFAHMQQRVTIGPLREDGRIVGAIVAIEDVTARIERERELAAKLADLDPQERREAESRLAAGTAEGDAESLLKGLGDESWRIRRATVEALRGTLDAGIIEAVLQVLRQEHRNFSVLSSAIEFLAAADVDVLDALVDLLRNAEPDLRLQAALLLGERGDARAIPALVETLGEPDDNLRFHAIEALGKLHAVAAVEPLTAIAETGDFFLGFAAIEALAHIGDPGVAPRLAPLLKNELLRAAVAELLGKIGDEEAVEPLVELLNGAGAPTEIVANALASIHQRYEGGYGDGEPIAHLVRRTIAPTGTQNLLDAAQRADSQHLFAVIKALTWLEGPAVERALTRMLGEPRVRSKVVEYLVRHGERVVDLLVEQLDSEDLDTRHAAVVGLGRIGDKRATPALLRMLQNEPELLVPVAGALARIGDPQAFEALLTHVGHPDVAVRQAIIGALNSIGHPDMYSRVCPMLRDPDPHVRESAVRIAGYFGYPECADALIECCQDADATVRRSALEHVALVDDVRALPTLQKALSDLDPRMRAAAVHGLARMDAENVAGTLTAALHDEDSWVRYFAVRALGAMDEGAPIDDLAHVAREDPAGHVRLAAVEALGQIAAPEAIATLAALAQGEDGELATVALQSLGAFESPDAWASLRAALEGEQPERRAAAAQAIGRLGSAEAVQLLEWTAAADSSGAVVAAAVQALASVAKSGSTAPAAINSLIELTADASRRGLAVAALGAVPNSFVEHVAHGLEDPRLVVRIAVLQALGRMRHADASRHIESALNDAAPEVRLAALRELRHLGTRGIERQVTALARNDPDAAVRRAAVAVLRAATGDEETDLAGEDDGTTRQE